MKPGISILIADDQKFMRESLRSILEVSDRIGDIYEAGDGRAALEQLKKVRIDVVLLDIRMPVMDGLEVIELAEERKLKSHIIALTAFDEEAMILNLMRARVAGILFKKTTHRSEIFSAIDAVIAGKTFYNEKVAVVLHSHVNGYENPPRIKLSAREYEIIEQLCHGASTKQIAEKLAISEYTVEDHRRAIIKKTNTKNTYELIHFATINGIVGQN